jgi:hypothetical protein|tara:strand:+ start:48 stop:206 length:159 start_codon:yes stop_codon:yes gene_type:complete
MTLEHGLGMFVFGMTAFGIGTAIAFAIVNYRQKKEIEEKERKKSKVYDGWSK